MEEKLLFKKMINGLMYGPSHIFVQPFLSGTAPQFVNSTKESSKVSFGFVNCPQLSLKAMIEIANHYAQKFDAEKFDRGEYKWMLCQPFFQFLDDTRGMPRALQYIFYECLETGCDGKKFFKTIDQWNFDNIFHNVKAHLQERYNIHEFIQNNKKLALELLYHSIDGIPVSIEEYLDESKPEYMIKNLERDAHIILNPCNTEDLNNEHKKNILGSTSAPRKLQNILSKYQHITIAFMIQPFNGQISKPDCLVIMKEYFGPIFASCARFT
jgi:hypothetical protein